LEKGKALARTVRVSSACEKRIIRGHRWIFSNEVEERLKEFLPGEWVTVVSGSGRALGVGYINPRSLIAVRLVGAPGQEPTRAFFRDRVEAAVRYRAACYPGASVCRLIFGESDGLPGLVVDRYGDVLVTQVTTAGMAAVEEDLHAVLAERLNPRAIVFRNDTGARQLEGLPLEKGVAYGSLSGPLEVDCHGLRWSVDPLEGQKTGFYLDQRDNREALRRWVQGKRVLDLFCYEGGWSLVAAAAGAAEVTGVDSSEAAVERARENARLNGLSQDVSFVKTEALDYLKRTPRGAFDVIVADPPAFAKTKSVLKQALKGYTDLNRRALLALKPEGILVTSSCSYHVSEQDFQGMLLKAALAAGRRLRLLQAGGQALDHPPVLAMPETRYLKCFFVQDVPEFSRPFSASDTFKGGEES